MSDERVTDVMINGSLSVSEPLSSEGNPSLSKHVDVMDEPVRESRSTSPASSAYSDNQLSGKKDPPSLGSYEEIRLVRDDSHSYAPSNSQQHLDQPPSFSVCLSRFFG